MAVTQYVELQDENAKTSRVTIQNLIIVSVDAENNAILVKGAVPGPKKSIVVLKTAAKGCLVKNNKPVELVNYSAPKAE